jgi:hypothetical protein
LEGITLAMLVALDVDKMEGFDKFGCTDISTDL